MAQYVTEMFTNYVKNKIIQEEILDQYPVPSLNVLKIPEVDLFIPSIFKKLKTRYGKSIDANWQHVHVLHIMGLFSHLWRQFDRVRKGQKEEPDFNECLDLIEKVITLVAQANMTSVSQKSVYIFQYDERH